LGYLERSITVLQQYQIEESIEQSKFSEKMDSEIVREIGASGYLKKPHEKRDPAKMVRKVLDGK
jgi:hypothetical protein